MIIDTIEAETFNESNILYTTAIAYFEHLKAEVKKFITQ